MLNLNTHISVYVHLLFLGMAPFMPQGHDLNKLQTPCPKNASNEIAKL